jgi:3-oxoacyl-[acyl-carrier protein] reductase
MTDKTMENRVALVTGGAGGIGIAICRRLATAGCRVVVLDIHDAGMLRQHAEALPGNGHMGITASVEDSPMLAKAATQVTERYGALDLLVNCAGVTRFVAHDDLDGLDDELIDRVFRVNWRGSFACIRAFRPLLEAGGDGLVVNISSIAAVTGTGSNVAYCASKAAMNAMTISLARVLAPRVRVVSVSPGAVDTDFIKSLDPAWRTEQVERTPLKRFVEPEEVAEAVLATATSLRFSTGCIIPVDGGRPLT